MTFSYKKNMLSNKHFGSVIISANYLTLLNCVIEIDPFVYGSRSFQSSIGHSALVS